MDDEFQMIVESRLDGLADSTDKLATVLGVDDDTSAVDAINEAETDADVLTRLNHLEDQMSRIESQLEAIQDLGREKTSKEEKIARLVQYAQNVSSDPESGRVVLKAKDIKGTAGVSRRYAYNLIDDLPEEYEWALDRSEITQYGDLEIDKEGQDRALVVDLDVLHTNTEAVNKFTTATSSEGASV